MNTLISHGGGQPFGVDVASAGTKLVTAQTLRKYLAITNTSDVPVYIGLVTSTDGACPFSAGEGIYLAPEGGSFELNNVNMYYGEIWAVHASAGATKRLSLQPGR